MDNLARHLQWFRRVDAELASAAGLRRNVLAADLGTSAKTVHRIIKAIESTGLAVESRRVTSGDSYWYVYRYTDRRRRLFR